MNDRAQRHFLGIDLGQAHEFTALAVLERPLITLRDPRGGRRPAYCLRHLQRWPIGTPYPEMFRNLVELMQQPVFQDLSLVFGPERRVGGSHVAETDGPLTPGVAREKRGTHRGDPQKYPDRVSRRYTHNRGRHQPAWLPVW
jgi:hypothetical protein